MRRSKRLAGKTNKWLTSKGIDYNQLSDAVLIPESLPLWQPPVESQVNPAPPMFIPKPAEKNYCLLRELDISQTYESNTLERHKKHKKEQLMNEDEAMKRCHKYREYLLLRRRQVLPRISSTHGMERHMVQFNGYEKPEVFPDWVLWAPIIFDLKEKDGLTRQLTKAQQGYTAVPEWVGCPEIVDEIRTEMGINETHILSSLRQNDEEKVCQEQQDCKCVPEMARLGVRGFSYKYVQDYLRVPKKTSVDVHGARSNIGEGGKSPRSKHRGLNRSESSVKSSRVSLCVGHIQLFWSTCPQKATKEWVVELGCSAEIGQSAIDYVLMRNSGTAVMKYNWVLKSKSDESASLCDSSLRGNPTRILFDSWGGIILPGEEFRIPFMYKAHSTGQFSQDWQLNTQPVLENGATVLLRLWGFTRSCDVNLGWREQLEIDLAEKMKLSTVKDQVRKIVDYLPLEDDVIDQGSPKAPLKGNEIFLYNNPFLHYDSCSVFVLERLLNRMVREMKRLEKEQMPEMSKSEEDESVSEAPSAKSEHTAHGSVTASHRTTTNTVVGSKENVAVPEKTEKKKVLRIEVDGESSVTSIEPEPTLSETVFKILKEIAEGVVIDAVPEVKEKEKEKASLMAPEKMSEDSNNEKKNTALSQMLDDLLTTVHGEELGARASKLAISTQALAIREPINANISVSGIRQTLLTFLPNTVMQEAVSYIMSEEIDKLMYQKITPVPNWKYCLLQCLLSTAMEQFTDYSKSVQTALFRAEVDEYNLILKEEEEERARLKTTEDEMVAEEDEEVASEASIRQSSAAFLRQGTLSRYTRTMSAFSQRNTGRESELETEETEEELTIDPLEMFSHDRYEQYHQRIYSRMYWLLSDVIDQLDTCAYSPPVLDAHYGHNNFTRVRNIEFDVNIETEMNRPLPPGWVMMYQRMEETRAALRERKEEKEENKEPAPPPINEKRMNTKSEQQMKPASANRLSP